MSGHGTAGGPRRDGRRECRRVSDVEAADVAAASAGDERAFERIVARHRRELHAHCYRMLGSVHDADDALQDALLGTWRGLPTFEGRSSLRSWLFPRHDPRGAPHVAAPRTTHDGHRPRPPQPIRPRARGDGDGGVVHRAVPGRCAARRRDGPGRAAGRAAGRRAGVRRRRADAAAAPAGRAVATRRRGAVGRRGGRPRSTPRWRPSTARCSGLRETVADRSPRRQPAGGAARARRRGAAPPRRRRWSRRGNVTTSTGSSPCWPPTLASRCRRCRRGSRVGTRSPSSSGCACSPTDWRLVPIGANGQLAVAGYMGDGPSLPRGGIIVLTVRDGAIAGVRQLRRSGRGDPVRHPGGRGAMSSRPARLCTGETSHRGDPTDGRHQPHHRPRRSAGDRADDCADPGPLPVHRARWRASSGADRLPLERRGRSSSARPRRPRSSRRCGRTRPSP